MRKFILFFFWIVPCCDLLSQDPEINWSQWSPSSNSEGGYCNGVVGANDSCVYLRYTNKRVTPVMDLGGFVNIDHVRLVCYDKKSMSVKSERVMRGFDTGTLRNSDNEKLNYHHEVLLSDRLVVFWTKGGWGARSLYAQLFSLDLKPMGQPQQVYKTTENGAELWILSNKDAGNYIVMVYPRLNRKGQVVLDYVKITADLNATNTNSMTLDIPKDKLPNRDKFFLNYSLESNGKLYGWFKDYKYNSRLIMDPVTNEFSVLSEIDMDKKEHHYYDLRVKSEGNAIIATKFIVRNDDVYCFGLYRSWIAKEKRPGYGAKGFFVAKASRETHDLQEIKFTSFDQDIKYQMETVHAKTKVDWYDLNLQWACNINEIFWENGDIVVIASQSLYSSVLTPPYEDYSDGLFYFRVTTSGNLVWAGHLDRQSCSVHLSPNEQGVRYNDNGPFFIGVFPACHSGSRLENIHTLFRNDYCYLVYDNQQISEETPVRIAKSSMTLSRDQLDFAKLNLKTGEIERGYGVINPENTSEKFARVIRKDCMMVAHNELFFYADNKSKASIGHFFIE